VLAREIIQQTLEQKSDAPQLYNINIPTRATRQPRGVRVVPMGVNRYGEHFLKRKDPNGRTYYWATSDPPPAPTEEETDLSALLEGWITLTPLHYDMTKGESCSPCVPGVSNCPVHRESRGTVATRVAGPRQESPNVPPEPPGTRITLPSLSHASPSCPVHAPPNTRGASLRASQGPIP
jgi:hypothetical protein